MNSAAAFMPASASDFLVIGLLLAINALISVALRLRLERAIGIAIIRMILQVAALGYALKIVATTGSMAAAGLLAIGLILLTSRALFVAQTYRLANRWEKMAAIAVLMIVGSVVSACGAAALLQPEFMGRANTRAGAVRSDPRSRLDWHSPCYRSVGEQRASGPPGDRGPPFARRHSVRGVAACVAERRSHCNAARYCRHCWRWSGRHARSHGRTSPSRRRPIGGRALPNPDPAAFGGGNRSDGHHRWVGWCPASHGWAPPPSH